MTTVSSTFAPLDCMSCCWWKLLDEQDWDIYYWSTGKRVPPERWANSTVLEKLVQHARNDGKLIRSMPALS